VAPHPSPHWTIADLATLLTRRRVRGRANVD
jgi:hypothetical protein